MLNPHFPAHSTSLIGRERELAEISARLADPHCRLLTLIGPGGVGKTRLAIEVACKLQDTFPDSSYFVPLQPLTSSDFVVSAIADAIGFQFHPGDNPKQRLFNHLREKSLLLLLDNFEHVLDAADLLLEILNHAPGVRCLVTSRERLRLREEWVFDVHGLSYPAHNTAQPLNDYSAAQLFSYSAGRAGCTLSDADSPSIIRICQLVEGMPLALELAAGWARVMSCAEIAREIERGLDILTTTTRNMPGKHRSMSVVFEQSWKLLSNDEEEVFRKLSVFRGGFTREAAEQVAGATLVILASLVDKSLLRVGEDGRYSLQELLRQYAAGKLLDAGEVAVTVRCHLDYFTCLAEQAAPELHGVNYRQWLDRLEIEQANLRTALDWCHGHDPEHGLRLVMALRDFWRTRGYAPEGLERTKRFLAADPAVSVRNSWLWANCLTITAWLAFVCGDDQSLRHWANEALRFSREVGDKHNISWALRSLGHCAVLQGDEDEAERLWTEGLTLSREIEDYQIICIFLVSLGILMRNGGNYSRAIVYHSEAVQLLNHLDDKLHLIRIRVLWETGVSWLFQPDYEQARVFFTDTLALSHESLDFAYCLEGFGGLAALQNRPEQAARLLGAAASLREKARTPRVKIDRYYEWFVAKTREQLNNEKFAEAWAAGQVMTLEQAVSYALHSDEPEGTQPTDPSPLNPLTERELEILHLLADGLSTKEVSQQLFLSVGTVRWYLNQIYSKLSVHSRIQAITRARELKLLG